MFVSLGFEGHTEIFGPHPFHVEDSPPHPKISGPKSLGLGSFFFPEKELKYASFAGGVGEFRVDGHLRLLTFKVRSMFACHSGRNVLLFLPGDLL